MSTTHSMDERDKGYGWLNGNTHMDERGGGVCTFISIMHERDPYSASCTILSATHSVCMCGRHSTRGGVWLVEWAPHITWMGETRGMAGELGHKHMDDKGEGTCPSFYYVCVRPPASQLHPSLCHPCYACVGPIQPAVPIHYIDPCFVGFDVHMCQ